MWCQQVPFNSLLLAELVPLAAQEAMQLTPQQSGRIAGIGAAYLQKLRAVEVAQEALAVKQLVVRCLQPFAFI